MIRDAINEIRFHPGRLLATLLAIALSVGFMAAVSTFMATQTGALGKMMSLPASRADVLVTVSDSTATGDAVRRAIAGVAGVQTVERSQRTVLPLDHDGRNALTTIHALPSERFRWARLTEGAWPSARDQITLSRDLADTLRLKVGDQLDGADGKLRVVGLTDDAPTLFMHTAYVAPSVLASDGDRTAYGDWLVALTPGTDAAAAAASVTKVLQPMAGQRAGGPNAPQPIEVLTAAEAQHRAITGVAGDFDVMKYMLLGFSAVAALVGMIIIANTFTILLAQRRRQIGLLRAVGASGGQVRGRFLAEAVLLGLLGSLAGVALGIVVAWIGALITKAAWFGLVLPWRDLALEIGVGVVLTVLAAMLPALKATRVAPLEALQPVATSEQVRRASRLRAVLTGLLFAAGVALAVLALTSPFDPKSAGLVGPLLYALAGAMLITVAVLAAAPLYVPLLLRAFGALIGPLGATPRLAAANARRNPSRAAATATALMLATGLIVTLQIGVATANKTMTTAIEKRKPIDLITSAIPGEPPAAAGGATPAPGTAPAAPNQGRLSPDTLTRLRQLPNIAESVVLNGGTVQGADRRVLVVAADPAMQRISTTIDPAVGDGDVLVSASTGLGEAGRAVALTGDKGTATLTVRKVGWLPPHLTVVSAATLGRLVGKPEPQTVWFRLADKAQVGATMKALEPLSRPTAQYMPQLEVDGSAVESHMIQQVLNILLLITTALLGVAVLIALIGVGNTLGLSVIERARESALLRALGMQRGSLRMMLLVEALLLAGVGILVGVAAGVLFGWLGMSAMLRQADIPDPLQLNVDWVQTLGMVAVAVAAAALASVLPGLRAAKASPTEALAAD